MQPPYAPNVVNQTVSYGGQTWKGNPGSGWSLESGGGGGGNTGSPDPVAIFKALQQSQQTANQPAIQSLQTQQQGLGDQYKALLETVNKSFEGPMNSAIAGENTLLGQRGITNDSPLYQQQMSQAQIPVASAQAGVQAQVGQSQITDLNQLASQIAQLQTGANAGALTATTGLTTSQNALQAGLAQAQAQMAQAKAAQTQADTGAKYITPGLFNTQNNSLVGLQGLLSDYVYQNGQWYKK